MATASTYEALQHLTVAIDEAALEAARARFNNYAKPDVARLDAAQAQMRLLASAIEALFPDVPARAQIEMAHHRVAEDHMAQEDRFLVNAKPASAEIAKQIVRASEDLAALATH